VQPEAQVAGGVAHAVAFQSSDLGATALEGAGGVDVFGTVFAAGATTLAEGHSFLRVVFTVSADAPFRLDAQVGSLNGGVMGEGGTAFFSLLSLDPGSDPLAIVLEATPEDGDATAAETGILLAGVQYELVVSADALTEGALGAGQIFEGAAFFFRLTDVPEPGTAAALLVGLAGLAGSRPSRRPGVGTDA
jgi:hypothetical protein